MTTQTDTPPATAPDAALIETAYHALLAAYGHVTTARHEAECRHIPVDPGHKIVLLYREDERQVEEAIRLLAARLGAPDHAPAAAPDSTQWAEHLASAMLIEYNIRPIWRTGKISRAEIVDFIARHAPTAAPDAEALRELAAELRADADAIENDPATLTGDEANRRIGYIQGLRAAAGRIDAVLFWSAVRAAGEG